MGRFYEIDMQEKRNEMMPTGNDDDDRLTSSNSDDADKSCDSCCIEAESDGYDTEEEEKEIINESGIADKKECEKFFNSKDNRSGIGPEMFKLQQTLYNIKEEDSKIESADEFIKLHRGEKIDIKPRKNHNVRIVNCCKKIKNRTTTILRTGGKEYTINGK